MRWFCCNTQKLTLRSGVYLVALLGCVTSTTRYFVPSRENPTYQLEQSPVVLREYVRLACPTLRAAAKPDSGTTSFVVSVDSLGLASRAEMKSGTGDELLDGIFGTVAAQLAFPMDSSRRGIWRERVAWDFRCIGDTATVSLFKAR